VPGWRTQRAARCSEGGLAARTIKRRPSRSPPTHGASTAARAYQAFAAITSADHSLWQAPDVFLLGRSVCVCLSLIGVRAEDAAVGRGCTDTYSGK
jgi:hypothetical protein